ncbi:unnamed protein product [Rotaria sordida]|uniref:Uncharacterized protein n=1 Tax=Rotaria sordida TaxID=392033 RepID=A0A815X818_9BILA|nr:unnamed protein product [Rotaria sordida]CAF1554137.1 unnamed protein product [Rotaria sordida]
MMDSIEKITTLFPKLKQQLLFLEKREKLFTANDNNSISSIDLLSVNSTNFNPCSSPVELPINSSTNDNTSDHVLSEVLVKQEMNLFFPDEYIIPTLPNSLLQDIETGALHKFAPHHTNRQILIDIITHDLIEKYHLL